MAFTLRKNESASAGLRRIAREQIEEALGLLERARTNPEEKVHELRKQLKKIRSVVRLVRPEMGEKIFARENAALRKLGRRLSPVRDASVRATTATDLKKTPVAVERRLRARRADALRRLRRGSTYDSIARELNDLKDRVPSWPLRKDGFDCIAPGLRRTYRQGRKSEAEAYAARTDEAFHEWRKRAKDLRYHVNLLEKAWPDTLKDLGDALHDLTDRLGDDHDLGDLRRVLETSKPLTAGVEKLPRLIAEIDGRRAELQADARPLGARIYSEKPKEFTRRIESYWQTWRSEAGRG
jgi:CHAD domain-containing protein